MIKLTRVSGKEVWINPCYIVAVCPDDDAPGVTAVYDVTSVNEYWTVKEDSKTIVNMIHAEEGVMTSCGPAVVRNVLL